MAADDEGNEQHPQCQRPETHEELVTGPVGELGIRTRRPANPWVSVLSLIHISEPTRRS